MIKSADFAWFPLSNPGIVSITVSFLLGVIGTFGGRREPFDSENYAEMKVRSLTGAGSEKATVDA
jgi:cation/acetate symporter